MLKGDSARRMRAAAADHRRRFEREKVHLPVRIRVLDDALEVVNRGYGVLRDYSPSGGLIEGVRFEYEDAPTRDFRLAFRVLGGELEGMEALCETVRVDDAQGRAFGVRFENVYLRMAG
ncbi:MAG: hypothetical protein HY719_14655 [Planctomycetes bacterium]|nr:hypothetical protein [Planctomycetota bacterium]